MGVAWFAVPAALAQSRSGVPVDGVHPAPR